MDYCKYVDVIYGNEETYRRYNRDGMSSKWFYEKALKGNTTPCAVLPFGKISVCSYSQGYSVEDSVDCSNCGDTGQVSDVMRVSGIAHLHHSCTADMQYCHNYGVVIPFYGDISVLGRYYTIEDEQGRAGYYAVKFNGIDCEVTVSDKCAYHHYYFDKSGGRIAVDFSNAGIGPIAKDAYIEVTPFGEILFSGIADGVKLYFCVAVEAVGARAGLFADGSEWKETSKFDMDVSKPFGGVFDFDGASVIIKLAYSTLDFEHAKADVRRSIESFDTVMNRAYDLWNKHLSRMEIYTEDEEIKHKFYSNLYYSLARPVKMLAESNLCVEGDAETGMDTLCALYNTIYPLVFMAYPHIGGGVIHLENGKSLEIEVNNLRDNSSCVESVTFNGISFPDMKIPTASLMEGGKLVFHMRDGGDIL